MAAWKWHPDNLVVGKSYKITHRTDTRKRVTMVGTFIEMDVEFESIWLWFRTHEDTAVEVPYAVRHILNAEEI